MFESSEPRVKINLPLVVFLNLICFGCFLFTITAGFDGILDPLNLPFHRLNVFRTAQPDQYITLRMHELPVKLNFSGGGTYRLISPSQTLLARNVTIHHAETGDELPRQIQDLTEAVIYDSPSLRGRLLFDFEIPEAGIYRFEPQFIDERNETARVIIFPVYYRTNRLIFLAIALPFLVLFLGISIGSWYWVWKNFRKPTFSLDPEEQQVKRDKWDKFIDDR